MAVPLDGRAVFDSALADLSKHLANFQAFHGKCSNPTVASGFVVGPLNPAGWFDVEIRDVLRARIAISIADGSPNAVVQCFRRPRFDGLLPAFELVGSVRVDIHGVTEHQSPPGNHVDLTEARAVGLVLKPLLARVIAGPI